MQISIWQLVQFFEAANYGTKLHFVDQTDVVLGLAVCNNKPPIPFSSSSLVPLVVFLLIFAQLQSWKLP